jgi:hypothetical protein
VLKVAEKFVDVGGRKSCEPARRFCLYMALIKEIFTFVGSKCFLRPILLKATRENFSVSDRSADMAVIYFDFFLLDRTLRDLSASF